MNRCCVALITLAWLATLAPARTAIAEDAAGKLPQRYQMGNGAYPWTGFIRAMGWAPLAAQTTGLWDAGKLLDERSASSRRIYTSMARAGDSPERTIPLEWHALDRAGKDAFEDGTPVVSDVSAQDRLDWLRGDRGKAALRSRETRLAHPRGARVLVVPPPVWQPGKPGHAALRRLSR
jgi:Tfp pilus tip-associated adhesin PilY1